MTSSKWKKKRMSQPTPPDDTSKVKEELGKEVLKHLQEFYLGKVDMSDTHTRIMRLLEPQFSIARALEAYDPKEEAAICAYLQTCETARKEGDLLGWRISRGEACIVEALTPDKQHHVSMADSFSDAAKDMGQQFVAWALKGAPQA